MNAITRTYLNSSRWMRRYSAFTWRALVLPVLCVSILGTALGVVYTKDLNRRLFIQHQSLVNTAAQYEVEWGRLLLEQGTLSRQSRVQHVAMQHLHMQLPASRDIVVINLDN